MKQFVQLTLLASTLGLLPTSLACTNEEDCGLNGICSHNTCICDPGWTGNDCGRLDLRPGPRANGYNLTEEGTSSWCNQILQDRLNKDLYHLIVSEFTHGCGLDYWSPFSRIIRAESTTGPLGPYTFKQDIAPSFAHNPTVIWSETDQKYLMYNIGCPQNVPSTCQNVNFTCGPGNTLNGESGISLWSSPDLYNWTSHGQIMPGTNNNAWDADITNPAPLHLSSHHKTRNSHPQTILAYRGCPYNCSGAEQINLAIASVSTGPYTRLHPDSPIFPFPSEDPFIWEDKRGNYHMLVHSLLADAGFGDGPNVGRHAFARSWAGPWTFNNASVAFTTRVVFEDGFVVDYFRRERPSLFFSGDGEMRPVLLSTGVQEVGGMGSYSLIQPIGDGKGI
ncbi:uncharacterized protein N7496_004736 [Penicillium cataractarum]|uniref:EGF-like domain-containing protein n=1 Tax=Penicillium cataractarum TaxID=2100454 RepID=A0A9W9SFT8_9EURO|nr:uncharacterized protein N7496_004736 [Penicillium cataractarum]KAJ5377327.1 hypothetical protein N7496_004736 [Penicillium cataractarum]